MPPLQPIAHSKQLLAEGYDAARLLQALVEHLQLADIQVQNFGGNWELAAFLKALLTLPNSEEQIAAIGIVRDADASPIAAFQSVCAALRKVMLSEPDGSGIPTETSPHTAVFILPDGTSPGMLESPAWLRSAQTQLSGAWTSTLPALPGRSPLGPGTSLRRGYTPTWLPSPDPAYVWAKRPGPASGRGITLRSTR